MTYSSFSLSCPQVAGQAEGQERQEGTLTTFSFMGGSFSTVTSDLGNSSDVMWEQDQAEDGTIIFRHGSTFHTPSSMHHSSRKSHKDRDFDCYQHEANSVHKDGGLEFYQHHHRECPHDDQEEDVVQLYRDKLERAGDGMGSGDEFEA